MSKFTYVGYLPDELTGGKPLEFGSEVDLSTEAQDDPHNRKIIEDARLVPVHTVTVRHPQDKTKTETSEEDSDSGTPRI